MTRNDILKLKLTEVLGTDCVTLYENATDVIVFDCSHDFIALSVVTNKLGEHYLTFNTSVNNLRLLYKKTERNVVLEEQCELRSAVYDSMSLSTNVAFHSWVTPRIQPVKIKCVDFIRKVCDGDISVILDTEDYNDALMISIITFEKRFLYVEVSDWKALKMPY